jgi:hypothetical protein
LDGTAQPTYGAARSGLDILPLFLRGALGVNRKGLKVKELAVEVGVTARELLARCRAEGMALQNSVTRLTGEQEEIVRGWFEKNAEKAGESR